MAEVLIEREKLFVRHKKGYRPYPMCLVYVRNEATGQLIGSGMAADSSMIYSYGCPVSDVMDTVDLAPQFDPDFLNRGELATGIMYNRGQF